MPTISAASLVDYRWLVGPDAAGMLTDAAADDRSLVAQTTRLRKRLSPARTHLLLEQVALRRRAQQKFAHAQRMFFTARGLEQATDEIVAACTASRFPRGLPLAELCCGIGGDLLALARRGPVVGVDRDPAAAILADANGRAVPPTTQ